MANEKSVPVEELPPGVDPSEVVTDAATGEVINYLDENGAEHPDPTPMAPPIGYKRQPSLAEQIREMVRSERLKQEVEEAGFETFEEADDFEVGDDYDPHSPHENDFDPPVKEVFEEVVRSRSQKAGEDTKDGAPTSGPVREDPQQKEAKPTPPKPKDGETG